VPLRESHREDPRSVSDILVDYSAEEMPTSSIEHIQRKTLERYQCDEVTDQEAFRLINLLLTIALMKLQTYRA
jgi:hypothetical protein